MPTQNLSYQELLQLVELIKSSSQFREFRFRSGDIELELRRGDPDPAAAVPPGVVQPGDGRSSDGRRDLTANSLGALNGAVRSAPVASADPRPVASPAKPSQAIPEGATVIRSPMVGTFYRAPEPGATPFVEVGGRVEPGTTVCIIEVMKLMNSIPAGCDGVVSRILVVDGEAVEYGQDLIVIGPA